MSRYFQGVTVELGGVPETLLWTLYHRAVEARRPDTVLDDPKAVELVDAIDYPFAERFGSGHGGLSQWQALGVRRFDVEVRRFLAAHPEGTVVALGEGLETQYWRVAVDGRGRRLPRSADHRARAVHVLRVRGRRAPARRLREALPRKRRGVRRRVALAQRGEPQGQARQARRPQAAAVDVGHRSREARPAVVARAAPPARPRPVLRLPRPAREPRPAAAARVLLDPARSVAVSRTRRRACRSPTPSAARASSSCCGRLAGGAARRPRDLRGPRRGG
jgi:hypothetical protein